MKLIYLDNNATTKPAPDVVKEMNIFLEDKWGNPSSMYTFGGNVTQNIENSRKSVADLIRANPKEIVFTGCGTESDNTALYSALKTNPTKRHIVTSTVEHPAVIQFAQRFEKEGYEVTYIPVDSNGELDPKDVEKSIRPDTAIVSIMWANNENGVIFPIEEIANICKSKNVLFHTDAVQAAGKIPIDVSKIPINFLSISAHKLHGPKGVGALYIQKDTKFEPVITGGHQEKGRRAGTENVASIVGFGKACELAMEKTDHELNEIKNLRDRLESEIANTIPNTIFNSQNANRLSNTSSISFQGIEGEAILLMMNEDNICASTGSACSSGSLEPSHVLLAMGISKQDAHGTIRFSLSRYTTDKDINYLIEKMPPIIKRLREMSPIQI